jgi:hypothetical protein
VTKRQLTEHISLLQGACGASSPAVAKARSTWPGLTAFSSRSATASSTTSGRIERQVGVASWSAREDEYP